MFLNNYMKTKILTILTILFLVIGCKERQVLYTEQEQYVITHIHKPKHFKIGVRSIKTNETELLSISKSCSTWKETTHLGDTILINKTYYCYKEDSPQKVYSEFNTYELKCMLCK